MQDIASRVVSYKMKHGNTKKEVKKEIVKEVSVDEKVIQNYKNGNIIKEVNLILESKTEKEDFYNKVSINKHAKLELYGKCENTKVKIVKIK
jgi:hypothetical protein